MMLQVGYLRLPTGARLGKVTGRMGELAVEVDGDLFDLETLEIVRAEVRRAVNANPDEQVWVALAPAGQTAKGTPVASR